MQCHGHARSGQHRRQQTLKPSVEAPRGERRVPARVITRTVVLRHVNRLKKTPEKGRAPKRRKNFGGDDALRQMIILPAAAKVSLLKSLLSDIDDDDDGCCSLLFPLSKNPWK
jgi:hypothetical protein